MKGLVLYKGPSKLTGDNIVVILTLNSSNRKTGNMAQTWILNQDVSPVEALKTQQDKAVCGSCPLRQSIGGACYVNVGQAPLSVWKSWRKGLYVDISGSLNSEFSVSDALSVLLRHKKVRFGAYGDPAAAPTYIWSVLAKYARGYTGYTHQLNHKSFDHALLEFCMISIDTLPQVKKLDAIRETNFNLLKSRTFRVITKDAPLIHNEILCPSSEGMECRDCLLCDGAGEQPNIAIEVHGRGSNKHNAKYSNSNLADGSLIPVIEVE